MNRARVAAISGAVAVVGGAVALSFLPGPRDPESYEGLWPWTTEPLQPYPGPVAAHALVMGAKYSFDGREGRLVWHAAGRRSDFAGDDHGRFFLVREDGSFVVVAPDRVRQWWKIDDPPKDPLWHQRNDPEFRPWYADQMETMPPKRN